MSRRKFSVLERVKVELKSEDLAWIKSRFLYDEVSDFLVTARNISKASRRRSATPICSSGSNRLGWGWRRSRYVYTHHHIINFPKLIFPTTRSCNELILWLSRYMLQQWAAKKRRELSDMSGAMKKKPSRISHAMCLWINQIFFPAKLFWVDSVAGWLWAQSDSHSTRRAVRVQVKIDIYLEEYESESYMRL